MNLNGNRVLRHTLIYMYIYILQEQFSLWCVFLKIICSLNNSINLKLNGVFPFTTTYKEVYAFYKYNDVLDFVQKIIINKMFYI